ncbi:uncharacterized protein (TIGR02413 family) [Scopulibacillus darangshiensis]|uniref:Uncharacterized protein (TIGR02413 family) n=1 Tax=Scopulibacillus darangshiensis TaxID=442528 RepID=A0A4V2SNS3_9BACL|nr:YrzI family small protein [Scopulibacillus darangshiensis]TCP32306.1 uncharacterized protein (TIGR02413 family) [Scopulibacillus darangshiensis]
MLKMNLFVFTLTVSLKKRKMTMSEYEDKMRIKELREDIITRRIENNRFL